MTLIDPLSVSIPLSDPRPSRLVYPQRKLLVPSPEHPDDYILEIDYSNSSEVTRCPCAAENKLVHARELNGNDSATKFGDLFHRCEMLRLEHGGVGEIMYVEQPNPTKPDEIWRRPVTVCDRQRELVNEHFQYNPVPMTDHRTASRMISTLDMYNKLYQNDGWASRVFRDETRKYIEVPYKVPLMTVAVDGELPYPAETLLRDPHPEFELCDSFPVRNIHIIYTGKIDLVLHDSNLLFVVDHKTSSRGGDEFWSAFYLSNQTRGYSWAAEKVTGQKIAGLIVNALIIRPPTQKVVDNTDLDRRTFFYSPDHLAEFEENQKEIALNLVSMLVKGKFPQYARSFKSPCSGCEYIENCRLPLSQRAADLKSDLFRDVTWNPMHE